MIFKPVTHVLFDMDGLILNTEDLYTIGFQKVVSRYGKEFTFALKCKIMGQQSREFAASIINALDLPLTVEEFLKETRLIFEELFPESKVMPGVEKLIRHLSKNNVPIGLATSSSRETYNMKVQKHLDLFDILKYKTWGSSDPLVKRGKPYPDIFLVAAAKFPDNPAPEKEEIFVRFIFTKIPSVICINALGEAPGSLIERTDAPLHFVELVSEEELNSPKLSHTGSLVERLGPQPLRPAKLLDPFSRILRQVLVFEDSINGVRAAHAAGMQVVMVPDSRLDRPLAPEATLILASMEDFRPEIFGLPPFSS